MKAYYTGVIRRCTFVLLSLALTLSGCGLISEHGIEREHLELKSIIVMEAEGIEHTNPITLNDSTVQVGESLDVEIKSVGHGCLLPDEGRAETIMQGNEVELDIFDAIMDPPYGQISQAKEVACPDIFRYPKQTVQFTFDEPGQITIKAHGYRVTDLTQLSAWDVDGRVDVSRYDEMLTPVTVERHITVTPAN